MGQSVVKNPKKLYSQLGGDPTLPTRVTTLENNEYKITYYEVVSGASGSLTLPTGATINAGEFGLSGNCVLSKIDGSNKPTFESPKTAGGTVVTASLNETTGAWVASGVYTDANVALIYSIKIKAINYSNLTYANIIETVADGSAYIKNLTSDAQTQLDSKAGNLIAKQNTTITHTGTTTATVIHSFEITPGTCQANDVLKFYIRHLSTNNANTKTVKMWANTSNTISGATQLSNYTYTTNSGGVLPFKRSLIFKNSLSSQKIINTTTTHANDEVSYPNNGDATLTLDFNNSVFIFIEITLANAGDTFTMNLFNCKIER